MRILSHFSMAVALATAGAVAITAVPQNAEAAKKKKKQKAPKLELSKEFRTAVGPLQAALGGEDPASAKPGVEALVAQPLEGDEALIAGQIAVNLGGKLKDVSLQEKGVLLMLSSGRAPATQVGQLNFFAGKFAADGGRHAEAQQYYQRAIDQGYTGKGAEVSLAESYFKENKYQPGLTALETAIASEQAAGRSAPEGWFLRGAGMAMKSNLPGASGKWTYKLVEAYPSPKNWRAALSVYRDSATPTLDNQQNLELMRLMRKADAMESERDYFEYADAAGPRRLPGEVVSVLEEGISKGAVRSSSSYTKEVLGLARGAISADQAGLPASERDAGRAANGKIALATADAHLGYSNYGKAATLYQTAISKGGIDSPRAQMGIGIAHAGQGNWQAAQEAFGGVNGSRKTVADFWTLWINQQNAASASASDTPPAS